MQASSFSHFPVCASSNNTSRLSDKSQRVSATKFFGLHHAFQVQHAIRRSSISIRTGVTHGEYYDQTPLLAAVLEAAVKDDVSFHVPGHKRGTGLHPDLLAALKRNPGALDLTELPGLDNLSSPTGVIREAQQLAARAFGADRTWFLVNGTSCGLHAAVLAACGAISASEASTLVVARNCHLSAISAMVLAGCRPQWVLPWVVDEWDMAHNVDPSELENAFKKAAAANRPAAAALIVSPTYFGVVSDIAGLAEVCHRHDAVLIVDEAHGAHFAFHDQFPQAALAAGADIAVQSTHKMLAALTQGSMLHVRGARGVALEQRLSRALQTLQTSSPSYLVMASLDAARACAQVPNAFDGALAVAHATRHLVSTLPGLRYLSAGDLPCRAHTGPAVDPLKVTVGVQDLGITGREAAEWLYDVHGIASELATSTAVLCALGAATSTADGRRLGVALQGLSSAFWDPLRPPAAASVRCRPPNGHAIAQLECQLTPREAFDRPTERIEFSEAGSRISAELLCPYPPGIPLSVPGEVLTSAVIESLRDMLSNGYTVTGASDTSLETVLVIQQ